MNPVSAAAKVCRSLAKNGFRETADIIRKNVLQFGWRWQNDRFDRKYNVDTGGRIELVDLQVDNPNQKFGVRYEPTPLGIFRNIMAILPKDLGAFSFVDFGSGKGRVLLLASHYRFRKVIGVEFARDLHEIAQRNIRTYRDRRQQCFDIESVHCDASVFPIPATPCVLYFYQPFSVEVMAKVMTNIRDSLALEPRRIYLALLLPHRYVTDTVECSGFAKRLETKRLPFDYAW